MANAIKMRSGLSVVDSSCFTGSDAPDAFVKAGLSTRLADIGYDGGARRPTGDDMMHIRARRGQFRITFGNQSVPHGGVIMGTSGKDGRFRITAIPLNGKRK